MSAPIDPVQASDSIEATYRRYLGSLLPLRDPRLLAGVDLALAAPGSIARGPMLEVTPPFATGATLGQLVDEGVLTQSFRRFFCDQMPGDRALYVHQEQSIRKAAQGRNLVIATGTGSGKTESFLIPILDTLARQDEHGQLGPGVRALLLYPMNALANDQLKRLRSLLRDRPEITFGRYTGDTHDDPRRAREAFLAQHGVEPPSNELVSRQEMQATPPHLLLTNYAMLEYLLLRPRDVTLFQGEHGGRWTHVVVDEAHVYDGIKGAEIAMLLRRLRQRVADGGRLQCLASSATVGDDDAKVADFGRTLFDAPFEWVPSDSDRQDVVHAVRLPHVATVTWGPLPPDDYAQLARVADPDVWLADRGLGPAEREQTMDQLRRRLAKGPQELDELAVGLFPDLPLDQARDCVRDVVAVGHRARGSAGTPILSARYHLFATAVEGAFACLGPAGPHVRLSRHERCPECDSPMFEIAACKRCGQLHLPGRVEHHGRIEVFVTQARSGRTHWLALQEHANQVDEDDELVGSDALNPLVDTLCAGCGTLAGPKAGTCPTCGHGDGLHRVLRLDGGEDLRQCATCGGRSPRQVRRFQSGADATAAVLASALYESLPPDPAVTLPGDGRRLLMFSDSRQQAAFAAPYLQGTYQALLQRRLVARALEENKHEGPLPTSDILQLTRAQADRDAVFDDRATAIHKRIAVATWLHRELIEGDERNSLEGTALASVRLHQPDRPAPAPLTRLGLTDAEAWDLLEQITHTLRYQGAVAPADDNVDLTDPLLEPRNRAVYVRRNGPDARRHVLSWIPGSTTNRRADYLSRVLAAVTGEASDPLPLLEGMWDFLVSPAGPSWLLTKADARRGPVSRIDPQALHWSWHDEAGPRWQCTVCRRRTTTSVRGVCPTNNCTGTLEPDPGTPSARDHYATLYRTMPTIPLTAEEHTAQLSNDVASRLQEEFVTGRINVLSCSTTFELGVDVGELQSVLLRNVPPTTANYVQRAGRAGRRTDSAALAVTFAQMRSHDQAMYARPTAMINGAVRAPVVVDDNVRVDRRHAHSVTLAAFFRHQSDTHGINYRTVQDFFERPAERASGSDDLLAYLNPPPGPVVDAIRTILPAAVAGEIGLDTGEWIQHLTDLVTAARDEYLDEVAYYDQRLDEDAAARRFRQADVMQRVLKTLHGRPLLAYLARRNVLPKYGFPVDTVELRVSADVDAAAADLDLSRDLTVAINEYAPASAIVARGKVITSAGVYRMPRRDLVARPYALCPACHHLEVGTGDLPPACPECGTARTGARTTFVKPEYGFVASRTIGRVGSSRPANRWLSQLHILDTGEQTGTGITTTAVGPLTWRLAVRTTLVALNEGPNHSKYAICDWCGHAVPGYQAAGRKRTAHVRPLNGRDCDGPLQFHALAHDFQTDALFLQAPHVGTTEQARSLLYALLAGASDALDVARDDLDGTVMAAQDNTIVAFDAVPAGAGLVRRIADNLPAVVDAALTRVRTCDCGEETSCHRCLRVYRNQVHHAELRRDHVLTLATRTS